MTDAQWLASREPEEMLALLRAIASGWRWWYRWAFGESIQVSKRKLCLFADSFCTQVKSLSERQQNQLVFGTEVHGSPVHVAKWAANRAKGKRADQAAMSIQFAVKQAFDALRANAVSDRSLKTITADLLRDVFGNPFSTVKIDSSWRTPKVTTLARSIYTADAFHRLGNLADALVDAGCNKEEILDHCRSDGPHVCGCWVVDLLLDYK
jgi:hypothetical protein